MATLIFSTDYPPLIGGLATYSYQIAKNLSKLEEVIVLAPYYKKSRGFDKKQNFSTIRIINIWGIRELLFLIYLVCFIKRHRPAKILNILWFPCGFLTFIVTRLFKAPYFVAAHGSEMLDDTLSLKRRIKKKLSWLKILTFLNARKIFPISCYTQQRLIQFGIPCDKTEIVSGGVDIDKFKPCVEQKDLLKITERYNLQNKRVLLTVGRLDEHKGHDVVIRSLSTILKRVPRVIYLIVGRGLPFQERRLRKLVSDLNLNNKVIFLGEVSNEDLPSFYSLSEIFIMLSREISGRPDLIEGFGICYLEANACSKPVIGGRSGGVPDAVVDGKTGLLVNPLDIKEISEAIYRLFVDTEFARQLGKNGRERVEKLTWQITAYKLKKLMNNFI